VVLRPVAKILKLLAKNPYDLLISDLGMPRDGRLRIIAEVRRRPAVKKIAELAMSGFGRAAHWNGLRCACAEACRDRRRRGGASKALGAFLTGGQRTNHPFA